jgi:hypothetical protein
MTDYSLMILDFLNLGVYERIFVENKQKLKVLPTPMNAHVVN